jgi:hypothetical protein
MFPLAYGSMSNSDSQLPNGSAHTYKQHQIAALRPVLFAGSLER